MRSKLFVPGSRPELFAKALAGPADALSFDLEDSVLEARKTVAREAIGQLLRSRDLEASKKTVIVRVNSLQTPHFEADVRVMACARLDLLNVPKVESASDIRRVVASLSRCEGEQGLQRPIGILANIESPRGLRHAAEIAGADPRVVGLQLGFGDLFSPLGIDRTDAGAVQQVQLAMRLAAGEAGIWAYDAAFAAVDDPVGYRAEALAARRLGYLGKTCIHPSQIALANEVFKPSETEIAQARRIVEEAKKAQQRGAGAFTVDGKMIDEPFLRRAQSIVAMAEQLRPE